MTNYCCLNLRVLWGIKFLSLASQLDTYRVLILLSPYCFFSVTCSILSFSNTRCMHLQIQPMTTQFSFLFTLPENASSEIKNALLSLKHCLCSLCVCVCLHVHSDTCISLLPLGLPDWVARVTYLTLRLVFLCWSSNYVDLGWRQSQDIVHRNILHGTICGTDFDVALKQILLPKWTLYWTLRTTRMALVLQWSSRWVHS